ncbi:MAG: serine hydrolase domain-containing protein [Pseudomonadota bacterium]|nr:serine hydrolase domain-containing protein [Pseudomonadota bacterium]
MIHSINFYRNGLYAAGVALALALTPMEVHAEATKNLPATKAGKVGMSSDRLARMTALGDRYIENKQVAGMVNLVMRNGKVVHYQAHGAKGASDDRPLEKDDLFRIYSMTKPITAVAAMQLYEQGKFQLSDPVAKFVPELKDVKVLNANGQLEDQDAPMTMHQLLTHTTGLSYGFAAQVDLVDQAYMRADIWAAKDLDEFAQRVAKLPLKFQPGREYHYSIAVDITGLVVQRLSGQPFDEYLRDNIFKPLGMHDTFFEVPKDKMSRFLPNHVINPQTGALMDVAMVPADNPMAMFFKPRPNVAMNDYESVGLFSGGGGLVSTAMDYARFAEMMRNGGSLGSTRILSPKTVDYMAQNHLKPSMRMGGIGEQPTTDGNTSGVGFGLGFGVITNPAYTGVIGSAGEFNWGGAAGTVFWIDPVEEIVVVSMIQLMGSPWPLRSELQVATYQAITESYQ